MSDKAFTSRVGKRGAAALIVQVRVREAFEPELYQLLMHVQAGTGANFVRSALNDAFNSGCLSVAGFSVQRDNMVAQLESRAMVAEEQCRAMEIRCKALEGELDKLKAAKVLTPTALPSGGGVGSGGGTGDGGGMSATTAAAQDVPTLQDRAENPAPRRFPSAFAEHLSSDQPRQS